MTHSSKWRQVVDNHVIHALSWYGDRGIKPTLRTLFYRLVSLELIPNTPNSYDKLSQYIVEARKEGRISWDSISDNVRYTLGNFNDYYVSPEEYVDYWIRRLVVAPYNYQDSIYKWHKQPRYVEIWIEKAALADVFKTFTKDRPIRIVINRGFASWTSLYENCKRLSDIIDDDLSRQVHVFYFGDYDPSGVDMDRHMERAFKIFRLKGPSCIHREIDFQRVAVTREQIEQFDLPPKPEDTKTLEKLGNDSRTERFVRDHGGELYAVELDALLAVNSDGFERLVKDSVNQYYDKSIYKQEVLSKVEHSEESIRRLVVDKLADFDDQMEFE